MAKHKEEHHKEHKKEHHKDGKKHSAHGKMAMKEKEAHKSKKK